MNTHTKKTIIALSIATVLISSCSAKDSMTKKDASVASSPEALKAMPNAANGNSMQRQEPRLMKVAQTASTDCSKHQIDANGNPEDAITIRVTGYGAPPKAFFPDPQRRLMAMRAAKIDAYRSLAERVTGIQIWGGTTIGDMVVEKDRFRVYIDTFISGARVIAENPLDDGTFETIVELAVGQSFLNKTLPQKMNDECSQSASVIHSLPEKQFSMASAGNINKQS